MKRIVAFDIKNELLFSLINEWIEWMSNKQPQLKKQIQKPNPYLFFLYFLHDIYKWEMWCAYDRMRDVYMQLNFIWMHSSHGELLTLSLSFSSFYFLVSSLVLVLLLMFFFNISTSHFAISTFIIGAKSNTPNTHSTKKANIGTHARAHTHASINAVILTPLSIALDRLCLLNNKIATTKNDKQSEQVINYNKNTTNNNNVEEKLFS